MSDRQPSSMVRRSSAKEGSSCARDVGVARDLSHPVQPQPRRDVGPPVGQAELLDPALPDDRSRRETHSFSGIVSSDGRSGFSATFTPMRVEGSASRAASATREKTSFRERLPATARAIAESAGASPSSREGRIGRAGALEGFHEPDSRQNGGAVWAPRERRFRSYRRLDELRLGLRAVDLGRRPTFVRVFARRARRSPGTKKSVKTEPMIMPETSVIPIELRAPAPGPGREDERQVAGDGRGGRHQDRAQARRGRLDDGVRACPSPPPAGCWRTRRSGSRSSRRDRRG